MIKSREHQETHEKIKSLKSGQKHYFNMFQDGGAACYECNGMYLLFEIPLYGGHEHYEGTYSQKKIGDLIDKAYSWA